MDLDGKSRHSPHAWRPPHATASNARPPYWAAGARQHRRARRAGATMHAGHVRRGGNDFSRSRDYISRNSASAGAWVAKRSVCGWPDAVEISAVGGASVRQQGCTAGPTRPQPCAGAQGSAVRERQGALRRGRGRGRGALWSTLRRVDVGVKEDGRRRVDGAQRAEDVGVLPAGLGRRRDVPVRRARRVQVHRTEGRNAQRVVPARLQPRCGGRRGGAARVSGAAAVARSGASSGARATVAG